MFIDYSAGNHASFAVKRLISSESEQNFSVSNLEMLENKTIEFGRLEVLARKKGRGNEVCWRKLGRHCVPGSQCFPPLALALFNF